MNESTLTSAARKALDEYNAACRELAAASRKLHEAHEEYARAMRTYQSTHGAAKALGIL